MNFSSIFPILSFICLLLSNQSFAQNQIDKTLLLSFAGVYSVLSTSGICDELSKSDTLVVSYVAATEASTQDSWERQACLTVHLFEAGVKSQGHLLAQESVFGEGYFSTADFHSVSPTLVHIWASNRGSHETEMKQLENGEFSVRTQKLEIGSASRL